MLLSMTGFGEAHGQQDGLAVAVEVRTINSRFLKLVIRTAEGYGPLEPRIDAIMRKRIRRGTIQVTLRVDRVRLPEDYRISAQVLDRYRQQLETLYRKWDLSGAVALESLLLLPGVVDEDSRGLTDPSADWPLNSET